MYQNLLTWSPLMALFSKCSVLMLMSIFLLHMYLHKCSPHPFVDIVFACGMYKDQLCFNCMWSSLSIIKKRQKEKMNTPSKRGRLLLSSCWLFTCGISHEDRNLVFYMKPLKCWQLIKNVWKKILQVKKTCIWELVIV